jgi:glycosyltransferase involved in cell wall biosynthesis
MADPGVRMQTILFVHSSSDLYGSDRCLLRSVQTLLRSDYRVCVCVPYDGPLVAELRAAGAMVTIIPLAVMRRSLFTPVGLVRFAWDLVVSSIALSRLMRREGVGIVHSNTTAVISGAAAARITGLPHIWHVREIILRPTIVRKLIAFLLDHFADRVVGVSRSVIDNLLRDRERLRSRSQVIYDGIDTSAFVTGDRSVLRRELGIPENEILVGMIGRVGSWKGQEFLLSAVPGVLTRVGDGVRFVAVGSAFAGSEERMEVLRQTIERAGLHGRFFLEEFRLDVANVLAAFDIFVLPSTLPDPFPNTVLEAMAAGKAIVANGHGGVTEMIVHGESGMVITPNDVNELSVQISTLVRDASLRTRLGARAQERVRALFDSARYDATIAGLYQSFFQKAHR